MVEVEAAIQGQIDVLDAQAKLVGLLLQRCAPSSKLP